MIKQSDQKVRADASPEKRLFISLLTRDIPLTAAFLDLIDNSLNAVIEPYATRLGSAGDFLGMSQSSQKPENRIRLEIARDCIQVIDDAAGIPLEIAKNHVFKFGRAEESHPNDRLSVYGIGLKRAVFKIGNHVEIVSDNSAGGFSLDLRVAEWARDPSDWTFLLSPRESNSTTGTSITVRELYESTSLRVADPTFVNELRRAVAQTYGFYLAKFAKIEINGNAVISSLPDISDNRSADAFEESGVSCAIAAGIGTPKGANYTADSAGWFVFCNGRTVVSADKGRLTGWVGKGLGLPTFQPKHRPFLGHVYFYSKDPELLPWTTTKAAIDEDSKVWQVAKRKMATVARPVIQFLDGRYPSGDGDALEPDLEQAGKKRTSGMAASASGKSSFKAPKRKPTVRIQYDAKVEEVEKIETHLGKPGMGGAEVGRFTFRHYIRNEGVTVKSGVWPA